MLPAHPELQRAEPARALDRVLVPIERLVLRTVRCVVLGRPMERVEEVLAATHDERADVVGLEEPLVRIDRDRVGELEAGHALRVARRQPRGAAVGGVHVEPQPSASRESRERRDVVDRAGVRRPGDGADRERRQPRRAVRRDRGGDRLGPQPEPVVGGDHAQRVLREPEDVEPAPDREVRLVARVDAHAVQIGTARGAVQTAERPQMDLAGHGERHEVGHHAAAGEHAPCARRQPDEVAEPADDLLLDEGADRARVPDVDALLEPLARAPRRRPTSRAAAA